MSVAAVLMALSAPLAASDPPPPVWQGVWSGTIGSLPVRACLARLNDSYSLGSYYYLSKLRTIPLDQQGRSKVWLEGQPLPHGQSQPRWTFDMVGVGLLSGTWRDGGRTLPFRLTRVAAPADEGPCGSAAFNAPRWRPLRLTASMKRQDGVTYRALSYAAGPAFPDVALDGFELLGTDAATRRINAALRARVPGKTEDWRGCISSGLDAHGTDGDYQVSLTPTLITSRWLAAELSEGEDCGGAHPNNATTPLTFDRATGAAMSLASWLTGAALIRDPAADSVRTVSPSFRRFLLSRAGEIEVDCREALEGADYWDIGLGRKGLIFTPALSHVEQACADPVEVPWPSLASWLSPAGRAGRATLTR